MEQFQIDADLKSFCDEASVEDLQALADLHEDPTSDAQIELYIYLCFLCFQHSRNTKQLNTKQLEQAIQRMEGWVAVTPTHHPDYNRRYSLLNTVAIWGHQVQAIKENIEPGILKEYEREKSAIEIETRLQHLDEKLSSLGQRFKEYGRLDDLEEAIETTELAISIAGGYITPSWLVNSGFFLSLRFERTGSMDDLDQAISVTKRAADATPHNDPQQADFSGRLGKMLNLRFDQTGSLDDLNQSISMTENAVNAIPCNHPKRVTYLHNLGSRLGRRFDQTGRIEDLNRAVRLVSDAVDAAPHDSLDRATCLRNLGSWLGKRFEHIGQMDDLDRAVIVASNALGAIPADHPERISSLSNLGGLLGMRFQRTKSMSDLNRAVSLISDAVDATPDNHPLKARHLSNLGCWLSLRFDQTKSINDLNQAINAASDAIDRTPDDHPERAARLSSFGVMLGRRFDYTASMNDLDRAIGVSKDAVDAVPHGHPQRGGYLRNLGRKFGLRFEQLNSADDLNHEISSYIASWDCLTGPASDRIQSAQLAANILIRQQDWEKSYQLLHDVTFFLHSMSLRSLNHSDAQAMLGHSYMFGFASSAAAVALQVGKTPGDALRLLELGRGVTASLLMDMREDVTELQLRHPELAEKFNHIREELGSPTHHASVVIPDQLSFWELQQKRRREADGEFSKIIDEIRTRPGFLRFLQPPGLEDLMNAAKQGPIIVVNVTSFRGDAFLIRPTSIKVIELPGVTQMELLEQLFGPKRAPDLSSSLELLWHAICRPCLDALEFRDPVSDGNWPHVWWIPTGLVSYVPLHAAGIYKQASKETVMDRVISSYASSIKALLHGRKRSNHKPNQAASLDSSALIVAMQDTPGLGQDAHLQFANAEIGMLQRLCPKLQLTPSMPQQRKDDVLEQLPKCKLFHFAGHGRSDSNNPSQSCLLLEDWETNPLTVGAVRDSRLQDNPPFLAYLSACSTGANEAFLLIDEGVHLISAFQLAGFQHVVGTLWEVSDKHCVDVARILYETLQEEGMTDEAVSRGLHRAVRALRDGVTEGNTQERDAKLARRKPEAQRVVDFLWVPYVHFGV